MASFTYDTLDRRSSKTINGQTQNCLYDGSDIIQESGTVNSVYTHGSGVDEILMRRGSTSEFYQADALGSIIGLTDDTATVKTAYSYSSYGKKASTGSASDNPYGFTGREDDGTGLYFYGARYYSPNQKRFIAKSPLEFGGGDSNFYTYVGGNLVSNTDPFGLVPNAAEAACAAVPNPICPCGGAVDIVTWLLLGGGVLGTVFLISTSSQNSSNLQTSERDLEYLNVKKFCDNKPLLGNNDCSTLSKLIDHGEQYIELYQKWEAKWQPGRHDEKISSWVNRLNNLKDTHHRRCTTK